MPLVYIQPASMPFMRGKPLSLTPRLYCSAIIDDVLFSLERSDPFHDLARSLSVHSAWSDGGAPLLFALLRSIFVLKRRCEVQ